MTYFWTSGRQLDLDSKLVEMKRGGMSTCHIFMPVFLKSVECILEQVQDLVDLYIKDTYKVLPVYC